MIAWVAASDSFIYCSGFVPRTDTVWSSGPNVCCKECDQPGRDHDSYDAFMKYALPFDDMWDVQDYSKGVSLV